MTLEELLRELEARPIERLRWRVLREFGVLPGTVVARELSDLECLICGAHMVLDGRRAGADSPLEAAVNESFDQERFKGLEGGEHERDI